MPNLKSLASFIQLFIREFVLNDKFAFWATLWGVRGNVRTSSIARWKGRSRRPIRGNWTFFASSYGWDVISRYWSKSALFRGGGSLWAQILGERRCSSPTIVGIRKLEFLLPHSEDHVILSLFIWVGYQRVTDERTDRRIAVATTAHCIAM